MDALTVIAAVSIVTAGLTIALGSIGPALGEARTAAQALQAIAQQPDESNTITRTLFVSLAMIEFDGDLLLCRRDDPAVRQPVLDLGDPGRGAQSRGADRCRSTG